MIINLFGIKIFNVIVNITNILGYHIMDNFSLFDNRSRWRFSLKEANMNKIKGLVRRFVALVVTIFSIFTLSVAPTYAAEIPQVASVTESTGNNVVLRRSMRLVAFNQAEINGKGTVTVHLDKTIWGGYIELTASGGHAEIVNVSVKFPDGSNEILGACASDGSASTGTRYFFYLPKGDYMFYADGIDHYFALACIYNK